VVSVAGELAGAQRQPKNGSGGRAMALAEEICSARKDVGGAVKISAL